MNTAITNSQLPPWQVGDIIIFKAPKDQWVSQCIALLTHSDVSHAAMIYDMDQLLETGLKNVTVSPITAGTKKDAHILRLKNQPPLAPLLEVATKYKNSQSSYDFPALAILAGLLLFGRLPLSGKIMKLAGRLLLPAALALDEWIQHCLLHHPERDMVCSQLVYQIYYEAGEEYRLRFDHTLLQSENSSLDAVIMETAAAVTEMIADTVTDAVANAVTDAANAVTDAAAATMRLIDLIDLKGISSLSGKNGGLDLAPALAGAADPEELARELWVALQETADARLAASSVNKASDYNALSSAGRIFMSKLELLKQKLPPDMPLDGLFITPADILLHTTNLDHIGMTHIIYGQNGMESAPPKHF